jgi:hypothetical protein
MALTLLDSVSIDHAGSDSRTIMLCQGDLANLTPADAVAFICVSALPNDYSPTPGSLIGALAVRGLSVQQQSQNKAANYEPTMPCWVSQDVSAAGFNFNRFILFEPPSPTGANAPGLVPAIFRALNCMCGTNATSIALPMVSTGSGGADLNTVLRQLFFSGAHFGAQSGWPVQAVKLVIYDPNQVPEAQQAFATMKAAYQNPPMAPPTYPALAAKLKKITAGAAIPSTMTQRQYDAVYLYTGGSYMSINAALRANNLSDPNFIYWQPTIEAISSGLAAMPNYSGQTLRGTDLPPDIIASYKPGATVTELAFTSSSWDRPWNGNTLLKIASLQGKNVQAISQHPEEDEVLYDYGLNELVIQVDGPAGGYQHVFTTNQTIPDWCNT